MKSFTTWIVLAAGLSLFGCTTVLRTQDQVMGRYKTRQDVSANFGMPNERMLSDTAEDWLYTYSSTEMGHSIAQNKATETATVAQFGKYRRYIIFSFDKHGNVAQWYTQRADLTEKKVSAGKTVILAVTVTGLALITAVLMAETMTFNGSW